MEIAAPSAECVAEPPGSAGPATIRPDGFGRAVVRPAPPGEPPSRGDEAEGRDTGSTGSAGGSPVRISSTPAAGARSRHAAGCCRRAARKGQPRRPVVRPADHLDLVGDPSGGIARAAQDDVSGGKGGGNGPGGRTHDIRGGQHEAGGEDLSRRHFPRPGVMTPTGRAGGRPFNIPVNEPA